MSINSVSVTTRLLVSLGSNVVRAALSFLTGLIIARALRPSAYGDLMFLLGTFIALRPLLDMGGSTAFFTFLSQRARGLRFYLLYFAWLALQFVVILLLVVLLIPDSLFQRIWLGYDRQIVLLAFLASFLQQQVWQTVGQIGEAGRKTIKVQFMNLGVVIVYLSAVALFAAFATISVEKVLLLLIAQYAIATLFACWYLRVGTPREHAEDAPSKAVLCEYWVYCRPLIALSVISFLFDFVDKWLLQRFGGPAQQGYFQIANQFAAISLLATTSILNVFWKEIAAAWAAKDHQRVARLYRRVNRGLVMLGAMLTGLLLPWAKELVAVFLGPSYLQAWPVLAIMLLYPIHQSMGQIGGTMLYASGQTSKYMTVSALVMLVSIPISYLMLAPDTGLMVLGLGLGAVGMALKMVVLGVFSVNIQAWVIARYFGWKFDWMFQAAGIPLLIGLGYLARLAVGQVWELEGLGAAGLVAPVLAACALYGCAVAATLYRFPSLVGVERQELSDALSKFGYFARKKIHI